MALLFPELPKFSPKSFCLLGYTAWGTLFSLFGCFKPSGKSYSCSKLVLGWFLAFLKAFGLFGGTARHTGKLPQEPLLVSPLCLCFLFPLGEAWLPLFSLSLWVFFGVRSFLVCFPLPSSMNWTAILNGRNSWTTSSSSCRRGVSGICLNSTSETGQEREFFPPEVGKTNPGLELAAQVGEQS